MLCSITLAHPGRTDSKGGHYNRTTGAYHYHHGYPEHQHTNGVCTYSYDDKTNSNSTFASNNATIKNDKEESNFLGCIFLGIITWVLGRFVGVLIEAMYFKVKSNKLEATTKRKHSKIIDGILTCFLIISLYTVVPLFFCATFVLPFYSFITFDLLLNGEYFEALIIIISTIIVSAIWAFINKSNKR